jgi:site-specific DNA-methyltransferase (adenine-specific)
MNWSNEVEVFNEDCMITMSRYEDNHFDLAIVDPPYGIDINKSGRLGHYGGKGKKWDAQTPDELYFKELFRVSKNQIIWGGNYFDLPPTRCFLVWDKMQPENVSFASCELAWTSFDKSTKTFYKRPQNADLQRIHPTQKPVSLYQWTYRNYAEKGFKILDTHYGGGSNGIALDSRNKIEKMELTLVACEIDKDYYLDAKKRFEKETSWQSIF